VSPRHLRPARIEIDASAVVANAATMAALVAPAALCAVVKADGYGHGAVVSALAALDGGASLLAVALVEEGIGLRDAGIDAPVLVLSEPPTEAMDELVGARLETTLYTSEGIDAAATAAMAAGEVLRVHLKVDTGMQRVGARPDDIVGLARAIGDRPSLELASVWTHLAAADEADHEPTKRQLARYHEVLDELDAVGIDVPSCHAANSGRRSPIPTPGSTWCGAASPCSVWRPRTSSPVGSTSAPRCGWWRRSTSPSGSRPAPRSATGSDTRSRPTATWRRWRSAMRTGWPVVWRGPGVRC